MPNTFPTPGAVVWAVDDGYVGAIDPTTGTYTGDSHPRVILYWQSAWTAGSACLMSSTRSRCRTTPSSRRAGAALPSARVYQVDKSAASLKGRLHGGHLHQEWRPKR